MHNNYDHISWKCINTIRFLAVDSIEQAGSGHPGTPLGAAPLIFILWDKFINHNPQFPKWINRDRFILSCGHASAMLYSTLHLYGYPISTADLKNFRQLNSITPGHPEYPLTPGVEMTTGPLGQGFSHGVGIALAENNLNCRLKSGNKPVVDHYTYVMISDGDIQEGVSSEAASFAGNLGLGKLICLYDNNHIQIEGSTDLAFNENIRERFEAYGWQVIGPLDGYNLQLLENSIREAKSNTSQPSLLICNTVIGWGSPLQGTAAVHGSPLGTKNTAKTKLFYNWPSDETFYVPPEVSRHCDEVIQQRKEVYLRWLKNFQSSPLKYNQLSKNLEYSFDLPDVDDQQYFSENSLNNKPLSTRVLSGKILNYFAHKIDFIIGGSADLEPSTKTHLQDYEDVDSDHCGGSNIHFGVREHAMGAIAGGIAIHGGLLPYTATFLTFSDYMRPPIRLAAMMGLKVIYIFTHDSIGLGEDGPTHQPIEHLMNLRAVPNLTLIRPADEPEVYYAWKAALYFISGPVALILSRQKIPRLDRSLCSSGENSLQGGYVLWENSDSLPQIILMGTGSELIKCYQAGLELARRNIHTRVVSIPSWEIFDQQNISYKNSVLPPEVKCRISVEAGQTLGWEHYVGLDGVSIGLNCFGKSAPGEKLFKYYNITVDHILATAIELLSKTGGLHD
ncbi:MAG: hypothetical protein APR63_00885 [Desulfuromonas sp. SDB]|nr:MAG: hypothetical protein APR63_00885 [Desulfuromonas sp. SDB]